MAMAEWRYVQWGVCGGREITYFFNYLCNVSIENFMIVENVELYGVACYTVNVVVSSTGI